MKVFVTPPEHLSRAMTRVAEALTTHAGAGVQIVPAPDAAELVVLHVIGFPETEAAVQVCRSRNQRYAIIQYCLRTTQKPDTADWHAIWRGAACVWSYYDLAAAMRADAGLLTGFADQDRLPFYYAPLGVDDAFTIGAPDVVRDIGVMTSGYVTGPCAEAIEEVAHAAHAAGLSTVHLGPKPVGLTGPLPSSWSCVRGLHDVQLAARYRSSRWVSGLRHGEGFELPALEGLCSGARPLLFDRPEMRQWYDGHGVFLPECAGAELIAFLTELFAVMPAPILSLERAFVAAKFDWASLVEGFWARVRA